jgi:enoyl-[acyl-carrier protein] reductase I
MSNNLLKGKRGVIFGALDENSIAWKTALKVHEEGGKFTLTNAPIAMRMGKINELAKACATEVIPADATSEQDLSNLFTKSQEILGGKLDFVLHSIGMSPNIRKGKEYGDMNYEWYLKTLDIYRPVRNKTLSMSMRQWSVLVTSQLNVPILTTPIWRRLKPCLSRLPEVMASVMAARKKSA